MINLDLPEPIPYDQHEVEVNMARDEGIILGLQLALHVMPDHRNTGDRRAIVNQICIEKERGKK
jgi:hypothetical protein